ncbi:MAG TPA: extracellular solute-binding protein [Candidatus Limnocylindrales bacterium]|nr:extracellular solute-binding protein [Candidatus Limnocylindrales bacterium]
MNREYGDETNSMLQSNSWLTRREFIRTSTYVAGSLTGIASGWSWLVEGKAPAFAQKRTLTALALSLFVPSGDERFRQIMEEFGKQAGCDTRFDTIQVTQLPVKLASEANIQSGHDLVNMWDTYGYLHEANLEPLDDILEEVDKNYSTRANPRQVFHIGGQWKLAPWYWVAFVGTGNKKHWEEAGLALPKTWEELYEAGKKLKEHGHPIGLPISHCTDANATWNVVLWCYGAKVFEADSKTIALNSPHTEEALDYARRLYLDCMSNEVLSWDDAGNNRFFLSGKGSWILNPVSVYWAARDKNMPIAESIVHHPSLSGPGGRHGAGFNHGLAVWKFSKNKDLAKEFLKFFYSEPVYTSWLTAAKGFCMSPFKKFEDLPLWKTDPNLILLPEEGNYTHFPGWPGNPTRYAGAVENQYIIPDMVARVVGGEPYKKAISWAEDQIKKILEA